MGSHRAGQIMCKFVVGGSPGTGTSNYKPALPMTEASHLSSLQELQPAVVTTLLTGMLHIVIGIYGLLASAWEYLRSSWCWIVPCHVNPHLHGADEDRVLPYSHENESPFSKLFWTCAQENLATLHELDCLLEVQSRHPPFGDSARCMQMLLSIPTLSHLSSRTKTCSM